MTPDDPNPMDIWKLAPHHGELIKTPHHLRRLLGPNSLWQPHGQVREGRLSADNVWRNFHWRKSTTLVRPTRTSTIKRFVALSFPGAPYIIHNASLDQAFCGALGQHQCGGKVVRGERRLLLSDPEKCTPSWS